MDFDFAPIDADNHYYESLDAFTRHLDPKYKQRGVQVLSDGRHTHLVIGGSVNRFIPNPTFDPIIVPGCLDLMFRGQIPEGVDPQVITGSIDDFPVVQLAASGGAGETDLLAALQREVVPALQGVEGVRDVSLSGVRPEVVTVVPDQVALAAAGLAPDAIAGSSRPAGPSSRPARSPPAASPSACRSGSRST